MVGKQVFLLSAVLLAALVPAALCAVAGIDLGSEHFKVVVVRPGSLDIALNEASGRKTATAIGFSGDERLLGDPAASQVRAVSLRAWHIFSPFFLCIFVGKPTRSFHFSVSVSDYRLVAVG